MRNGGQKSLFIVNTLFSTVTFRNKMGFKLIISPSGPFFVVKTNFPLITGELAGRSTNSQKFCSSNDLSSLALPSNQCEAFEDASAFLMF